MQITKLVIKNFRALADVSFELHETTVLIGENNTGKSAVLDAIRLALGRAGLRRSSNVSEYDFHLPSKEADPRTASPITIELEFAERTPGEWVQELTQALAEIVQLDPHTGLSSIRLRVTWNFDEELRSFQSKWTFLNLQGDGLMGKASWASTLSDFLQYVPVFYLSALRNVEEQFAASSQFWGRLLRSVEIPDDKREEVLTKVEALNADLLQADPKLESVTNTLGQIGNVVAGGRAPEVSLRALPLRIWDLMAKSEVVLQTRGTDASFPINRHGQGVQSLAVLFLFQAFAKHMLSSVYVEHSEPILALEEPEAHLHPQAARALWAQVTTLPGQKLVSTHSPYFVQNVPFRQLRVLRRSGDQIIALSLRDTFSVSLPMNDALKQFLANNSARYTYNEAAKTLLVRGVVPEDECRDLIQCFTAEAERGLHSRLRELQRESRNNYIPEDTLQSLETYVRRMRGEMLFARCWILCEGQTEYILLHQFASMLKSPLDANGIGAIDYQNNGSPGAFAALARSLGYKWIMFSDSDAAEQGFRRELENWGFSDEDREKMIRRLPATNVEEFMATSGLAGDLRNILTARGVVFPADDNARTQQMIAELGKNKGTWAAWLSDVLRNRNAGGSEVPKFFADIIKEAIHLANS